MGQTMHHGDFYLALFAEINRSFFDPFLAAGRFVDNMAELFACDHVIHRTHSRFHHTARDAEDGAGACVLRHEGAVVFAFRDLR